MGVGYSQWWLAASAMTPKHHICSAIPHFSYNLPPPVHALWQKGAPICPSIASQGAKTLCIHPKWMCDTNNGGWQPQP